MQGMVHTINNDRLFEMDAVAQDEIVRLGDLEVWEFVNLEGGGGGMGMGMMNMDMPHPMHIHGVQFQVFERQIARGYESVYQELSGGFVDEGWKDTVLVMPGETVRVLVRFENYTGIYLYHCHNLEHEDAGCGHDAKLQDQRLSRNRLQKSEPVFFRRVIRRIAYSYIKPFCASIIPVATLQSNRQITTKEFRYVIQRSRLWKTRQSRQSPYHHRVRRCELFSVLSFERSPKTFAKPELGEKARKVQHYPVKQHN